MKLYKGRISYRFNDANFFGPKGVSFLMDQYMRNVKVIEDAFEQIKEASGISNIEEIVTTFVKAEEQNHSLYNYVNMLNTETDVLEESNRDIKEQIQRILERGQMSEREKHDLQRQLETECSHLEAEIDRNLREAEDTKNLFRRIQPQVEKMINEFTRTKFFLSVAHKQIYESGFTFNESNIVAYLAELEEYIAILITYLATKRDDPSAPFALVPLDKLDTKNHFKKDLAIEAPVGCAVNQDSALPGGMSTADVETEIINSKQLYQTFMRLVEGNTINFITQGQANRGGGQQHQNNAGAYKGQANATNAGAGAANDDDFN